MMTKPTNHLVLFALLSAATNTFSAIVVAAPEANTTDDAIDAAIEVVNVVETRQLGKRHGGATTTTARRSGTNTGSSTSTIIGGVKSKPGDFPYFVDMGGCGGALIAPDVVLSAAHCGDWKGRQVAIGAYKIETLSRGAVERFCDEWIPDPKYRDMDWGVVHDYALCKLNEPVVLESISTVATLELNEDDALPSNDPSVRTELIVMGVGDKSEYAFKGPKFLHNVTLPYIPSDVCKTFKKYRTSISDTSLCAGFVDGRKDACTGDSGGPLVLRTYVGDNNNDNTNALFVDTHVGVVSWGLGCARANKPGVYARTSARIGWIKATACNTLHSVADFCREVPGGSTESTTTTATTTTTTTTTATKQAKKKKPTPSAPTTTSSYSCSTGQDLTIRLTTDEHPYETGWVLENARTYQTIMVRKYMIKNHPNEHKICLPLDSNGNGNGNVNGNTACYTWEVSDLLGDGFDGTYSITLNGNQIAAGNGMDFTDRKRESFCTNDDDNDDDVVSSKKSKKTEKSSKK